MLCSVQGDIWLQMILADRCFNFFLFPFPAHFPYQMKMDFVCGITGVVFSQPFQETVETMPEVNFGDSYQVEFLTRVMQGRA